MLARFLARPSVAVRSVAAQVPRGVVMCCSARATTSRSLSGMASAAAAARPAPAAACCRSVLLRRPAAAGTGRGCGARLLSTGGGGGGGGPAGQASQMGRTVADTANWVRDNRTVVLVLAGASAVMYGFYRGSMRIMSFFFNVTDKQIVTIGFMAGVAATLAIAGAGALAHRHVGVSPDALYHAALKELRTRPDVTKVLGGAWRPSGFRGFKIESMKEALQGSERRQRSSYFQAPSRRVQMIFLVRGMERDGMVSLEAHKRAGNYHFDMLSLDLKAVRAPPPPRRRPAAAPPERTH